METKFLISKCSLIPSEGSSLKENYDIVRGNPIIDYYESSGEGLHHYIS